MPIRDNENGVRVVEFGTGDILVCSTKEGIDSKYNNGIAFIQCVPHPVGTHHPEVIGLEIDQIDTRVYMTFSSLESIDVVIETLQIVRADLVAATKEA